jgi:hypothetical protein
MKKLLFSWLAVLLMCSAPWSATAADTVTVADVDLVLPSAAVRGVRQITFTFSSDDGTIARAAGNSAANVLGTIVKAHYIPDGTNTPDAGADIQLFTHLTTGVNILYGMIDNVGATETIIYPATATVNGPVFLGKETIYFSAGSLGAGTNGGILRMWVVSP